MFLIALLSFLIGVVSFLVSANILGNSVQNSLYVTGIVTISALLLLGVVNFLTLRISSRSSIGMALGIAVSVLLFFGFLQIIDPLNIPQHFVPYVKILTFCFLLALGISLGIYRSGDQERSIKTYGLKNKPGITKILDTSVIIDGRIADVADAGFIEGEINRSSLV